MLITTRREATWAVVVQRHIKPCPISLDTLTLKKTHFDRYAK